MSLIESCAAVAIVSTVVVIASPSLIRAREVYELDAAGLHLTQSLLRSVAAMQAAGQLEPQFERSARQLIGSLAIRQYLEQRMWEDLIATRGADPNESLRLMLLDYHGRLLEACGWAAIAAPADQDSDRPSLSDNMTASVRSVAHLVRALAPVLSSVSHSAPRTREELLSAMSSALRGMRLARRQWAPL